MRVVRYLIIFWLGLTLIVGTGVYVSVRGSLPTLAGELPIHGLGGTVSVLRDSAGVPHVKAGNRLDLARATGFLHAQERFFQMDLMRRDAAGELSALFGVVALEHDTSRRLHGLRHVAERALKMMPAARRQQLDAYTQGVNSGLTELTVRPPEYLLLRHDPAPWLPEDTLLVVHAMWFTLTDEKALRDRSLTRIHKQLPKAAARFIHRWGAGVDAAVDDTVIADPAVPPEGVFDLRTLLADVPLSRPALLPLDHILGSNAFVVSGQRAGGGPALLANDMHLGLRVPNIWYRMQLEVEAPSKALKLTGVTLPGTPAVVVGSNGHLAWGFTNAYVDVADRIEVELGEAEGKTYRTSTGTREFVRRVERIEIARAAPVNVEFSDTIWGPVVPFDGELHAIRWAAHFPEATNLELMQFEPLHTVEQALEQVRHVGIPAQNLLVADRAGSIGWTVIGRVPARIDGVDHDRALSWKGLSGTVLGSDAMPWAAPSTIPQQVNPEDGVLWSANARMVGGDSLSVLGNGNYHIGARARQIRDALRSGATHDEASALQIMLDDRVLYLQQWHHWLIEALHRAPASLSQAAPLKTLIASWSGRALPQDAAHRWIHEFRDTVRQTVMGDIASAMKVPAGEFAFEGVRQIEGVVVQLLREQPRHWLHPRHPSWESLLDKALRETVQRVLNENPGPVGERTWAERNGAAVAHPLARAIPELASLLNMPHFSTSGDALAPKVMRGSQGASERIAVRPGSHQTAVFHMPGGQSGHPLSSYYTTGFSDWVQGKAAPLIPGDTVNTLTLVPRSPANP